MAVALIAATGCTPSSQNSGLIDEDSGSSGRQAVVIGGASPSPSPTSSPSDGTGDEDVTTSGTQNCATGEYVSAIRIKYDNSGITDVGILCTTAPLGARFHSGGVHLARGEYRHSTASGIRLATSAASIIRPSFGSGSLVTASWLLGVTGTSHTVVDLTAGAATQLTFEQRGELVCSLQSYVDIRGLQTPSASPTDPCSSVTAGIIPMSYTITCESYITGLTGTFDSSGHLIALEGTAASGSCTSSSVSSAESI